MKFVAPFKDKLDIPNKKYSCFTYVDYKRITMCAETSDNELYFAIEMDDKLFYLSRSFFQRIELLSLFKYSLIDAKSALEKILLDRGYIFVSQNQFDKLILLK